jgi:ferredoxin
MDISVATAFEEFLYYQDQQSWSKSMKELIPFIHEVDQTATQIWFYFFPLQLLHALQKADDPDRLAKRLLLQGHYYLKDQIDTSHHFLYGHRFWPSVKESVASHAERFKPDSNTSLSIQIREVAQKVANEEKVKESLLIGITSVAFMILQQVGLQSFKAASGKINVPDDYARRSPEQILKERARDDKQGILSLFKTTKKSWTVTFDEKDRRAKFKIVNQQEIATGAATDKRDWSKIDPRCIKGEGPIPVECRSAACGVCWVGVIGGAEKLSEVTEIERRKIKEFGYIDTNEAKPLIRLSCMAKGTGAISIVIPPWNGIFGKHLKQVTANSPIA